MTVSATAFHVEGAIGRRRDGLTLTPKEIRDYLRAIALTRDSGLLRFSPMTRVCLKNLKRCFAGSLVIAPEPPARVPLVREVITGATR